MPTQLDVSIIEVKSKVGLKFCRNIYSKCELNPANYKHEKPSRSSTSLIVIRYIFFIQFDAEFRRFPLDKAELTSYDEFRKHIQAIHKLQTIPFTTWYTDMHGDLLPINNDDNFLRAVTTARPLLRVFVQRKGTHLKSKYQLNVRGRFYPSFQ